MWTEACSLDFHVFMVGKLCHAKQCSVRGHACLWRVYWHSLQPAQSPLCGCMSTTESTCSWEGRLEMADADHGAGNTFSSVCPNPVSKTGHAEILPWVSGWFWKGHHCHWHCCLEGGRQVEPGACNCAFGGVVPTSLAGDMGPCRSSSLIRRRSWDVRLDISLYHSCYYSGWSHRCCCGRSQDSYDSLPNVCDSGVKALGLVAIVEAAEDSSAMLIWAVEIWAKNLILR